MANKRCSANLLLSLATQISNKQTHKEISIAAELKLFVYTRLIMLLILPAAKDWESSGASGTESPVAFAEMLCCTLAKVFDPFCNLMGRGAREVTGYVQDGWKVSSYQHSVLPVNIWFSCSFFWVCVYNRPYFDRVVQQFDPHWWFRINACVMCDLAPHRVHSTTRPLWFYSDFKSVESLSGKEVVCGAADHLVRVLFDLKRSERPAISATKSGLFIAHPPKACA